MHDKMTQDQIRMVSLHALEDNRKRGRMCCSSAMVLFWSPRGASNKQFSIRQQWFVLRVTTRDPVNRGSRLLLMLHSRPYLHSRFCDKIRFVLIFTWAHRYRKHDLMDLTGSTSGLNLLNRSRHRLYIVSPREIIADSQLKFAVSRE